MPSAKIEMAKEGSEGAGAELEASADSERWWGSGPDISTPTKTSTSKLMTLLKVSVELATDMCEHAESGRDRTGMPGEPSTSVLVCSWGTLL
jgi:hypothetical protein